MCRELLYIKLDVEMCCFLSYMQNDILPQGGVGMYILSSTIFIVSLQLCVFMRSVRFMVSCLTLCSWFSISQRKNISTILIMILVWVLAYSLIQRAPHFLR